MSEIHHIASAAALLGDRHATPPSGFRWFSERVGDCLKLPVEDALSSLAKLITDAELDKQAGYGPPADDINKARRKWLDLYNRTYLGEQP